MDYKRRKLEMVGLRQGAPSAVRMGVWPLGVRKTLVALAGFAVLILGVAFIFLPAPGLIVSPLGVAILAREFAWARRLLPWSRAGARRSFAGVRDQLAKVARIVTPASCP